MNAEDIKMGEWYRRRHDAFLNDVGEPCTPVSTEFDEWGTIAFRKAGNGNIFTAFARQMEPAPKPVVYPELWIVMSRFCTRGSWNSLSEA